MVPPGRGQLREGVGRAVDGAAAHTSQPGLRGGRGETKSVSGQTREKSQKSSCAERLTSISSPGLRPSRRGRGRSTKPKETVTKLIDDPGAASHLQPRGGELAMKADGRKAEAHLGRGADGAGGVAVARVGCKPWGARGLLGLALMVG